MRILMLVATSVATDTRVLREARTLVSAGHSVHIIGKSVPEGFEPDPGITVSSVGTSSVFRAEGGQSLSGRRLSPPVRFARWLLLPTHRASAFKRWADGVLIDGRRREFDVVHAHDYTALAVGAQLAGERGVDYVYDTHEFWTGMARQYRPTPLADLRERRAEARLGGAAAEVITVADGIKGALAETYGWQHVTVVQNTFVAPDPRPEVPDEPTGLIYAGRLAAFRDLEAVAEASRPVDQPIELRGPADDTWLASFDPGRATVAEALPLQEVSERIAAAGISLITLADGWRNHELTIPNKVFHAVSLGVPVVASDVGELAKVVRRHDLGALYPPGDAVGLAEAIRNVVQDFQRYACNVEAARAELSWDADAARLLAVYERLGSGPAGALGRTLRQLLPD